MDSSNDGPTRKKFTWTDQLVLTLCDLLKNYLMTNGRTSHFKWIELQPQFENIANTKLYSHKVLKNKYDEMRREYINWSLLKNEEIGVPGNENKVLSFN